MNWHILSLCNKIDPSADNQVSNHSTKYKYIDVQRRGCDCGLFTIAYVKALINYQKPRNLAFALNAMRVLLFNYFEQCLVTMFPVMKTRWATVQVKA